MLARLSDASESSNVGLILENRCRSLLVFILVKSNWIYSLIVDCSV